MEKKAQLKIQQMAFMLVAVFLFFVLAGLFYLTFVYKDIVDARNKVFENQAAMMAKIVADYPEFSCGKEKESEYCIDTDKIIIFNYTRYKGFFPPTYVKVVRLYPEAGTEKVCNLGNYPENCNVYNVYNTGKASTASASNFVALCRWSMNEAIGRIERKCELGKIVIGYEVKAV